jgi:hypothetical protein
VKQILEENYGVRRTLDYYACRMFSSRQGANESIASWISRIDILQSELTGTAYRICEDVEVIGAMGFINHLAKACFVQGLSNYHSTVKGRNCFVVSPHRRRPRRRIGDFICERERVLSAERLWKQR